MHYNAFAAVAPLGELAAFPRSPSCVVVRCPVSRVRLSERFRAKKSFIVTPQISRFMWFLDEVFICLCIRTVILESLDWWGWWDLREVVSWR